MLEATLRERVERLEQFAKLLSPMLWEQTAPYVFAPGDVIASKVPRHKGMQVTIESVHPVAGVVHEDGTVGPDEDVFRCLDGEKDVHLFRYKEMALVKSANTGERHSP